MTWDARRNIQANVGEIVVCGLCDHSGCVRFALCVVRYQVVEVVGSKLLPIRDGLLIG